MSDITQAVEQQAIADSILDAPIVGSWYDGELAEAGEPESQEEPTSVPPGGGDLLEDQFVQRAQPEASEQRQTTQHTEAQPQPQAPVEITPHDVEQGLQALDSLIEQHQLHDPAAAQQLAYDLSVPFGGDPSKVDAGLLGGTLTKAVLSAASVWDQAGGKQEALANLGPISRASADRFASDFLTSFGVDPRTVEVDRQGLAALTQHGLFSLFDAAKTYGANAPLHQLNSPEAAEWFANGLLRCFGLTQPMSREYALQLTDSFAKPVLGILQKLQQLQPQAPARQARGARASQPRRSRFKSNQDIFDEDAMDELAREKTTQKSGAEFAAKPRGARSRFQTNSDIFDEGTMQAFSRL